MKVTTMLQRHAGDSYGYRFEANGRSIIYTTDSEHKLDDPMETESYVAFFRNADVVIFDAMYSLADAISVRADWGHSSNVVGVELCQMAGARHLCLFHHEPAYSDQAIDAVLDRHAASRGDHAIGDAAQASPPRTTAWKSSCEALTAASGPDARRTGRIRLAGIAVLLALAVLIGREAHLTSPLRSAWFDAYQRLAPRVPQSMPVTVVEIDQKSLAAIGQWPWPRSTMAELVDAISRERPAAIALDILMPKPTGCRRNGCSRAPARRTPCSPRRSRAARRTTKCWLARSKPPAPCSSSPARTEPTGMPLRAPPFTVHDRQGSDTTGKAADPALVHYPGVLTSIDALDRAASGRGLISVDPEGGVDPPHSAGGQHRRNARARARDRDAARGDRRAVGAAARDGIGRRGRRRRRLRRADRA